MTDPIAFLRSLAESKGSNDEKLDAAKMGIAAEHIPVLTSWIASAQDPNRTDTPVSPELLLGIRVLGRHEAIDAIPAIVQLTERYPLDEILEEASLSALTEMGSQAILPLGALLLGPDARTGKEVSLEAVRARLQLVTRALVKLANDETLRTAALSMLRTSIEPRTPRDVLLVSYSISALLMAKDEASAAKVREAFARGDVDEVIANPWESWVEEFKLTGPLAEPLEEGEGPLRLRLRCRDCGAEHTYRVPRATIGKARENDVDQGVSVVLHRQITCVQCGAIDRYTLAPRSLLHLQVQALESRKGESSTVSLGEIKLSDGTAVTSASQALQRARELAEAAPTSAIAQRRVGNVAKAMGYDVEVSIAAWKKAVELDPNELDSGFQLAVELTQRGDLKGAMPYVEQAFKLLPTSELDDHELHWTFCVELAEILTVFGRSEQGPHAIELSYNDTTPNKSFAKYTAQIDLKTFTKWPMLAQFLFSGLVQKIEWHEGAVDDSAVAFVEALDEFEKLIEAKQRGETLAPKRHKASPPTVSTKWQSSSKKKKKR
ncbi:MAG: hypothetical protein U0165_01720 [Polyangiaceae bacterium]